jgi:hypothetical protein
MMQGPAPVPPEMMNLTAPPPPPGIPEEIDPALLMQMMGSAPPF